MLQPATHACRRAGGFRCQIACATARLQVAQLQHQCSTLSCHLRISCGTMYLLACCLIFSADGVFSKSYVTSSNLYKFLLSAPDALPKHESSECRHACRQFSNVGVSVVLGRSIVLVLRRNPQTDRNPAGLQLPWLYVVISSFGDHNLQGTGPREAPQACPP